MKYLLFGWILILISNRYIIFIIPLIIFGLYFLVQKKYRVLIFFAVGIIIGLITLIDFVKYPYEINSAVGIVYSRKENYFLLFVNGNKYYVYQENHSLELGDIISIQGDVRNIKSYSLEGQFDFSKYLYDLGVERSLENYQFHIIFSNPLRINKIIDEYLLNFSNDVKNLLGIIFFNRSNYEITSSLYNLKIGHLFTMSGIQVYSLFYLSKKIMLFFNNNEKLISKISFILLIPMLVLSSFKFVFIKALAVIFVGEILQKKDLKNSINITLLIGLLLFNNRYIFTSSFVYVFLIPAILKFCYISISGYKNKIKNFLQLFIINQLCNIYEIFINGEWNLFGIIFYPIGLFFSNLIIILGVLSFIIPIYEPITFICKVFLDILNYLNNITIIISLVEHNIVLLLFQIVLFIVCMYFIEIKLNKTATSIFLTNIFVISLCSSPLQRFTDEYISFINVGQGDCALIHHNNTDILIDTGGSKYDDIASEVVYPYLKKRSINQIDAIFISHNDFDHNGALSTLLKLIKVDRIFVGSTFYEVKIGGITFKNLNTFNMGVEDNDHSSIISFNFIEKDFLFMGDASSEIEMELINTYKNIPCDILKVGHHGSNTSSSIEFLKFINPDEAVISVGKNNYYKHPSDKVIYNLKSLNIMIRRTDIEGTIQYRKNFIPF